MRDTGKIPVVIDCDPGYDDAIALMLAAGCGQLEILAVTAVAGNGPVDSTYRNAARVLSFLGADVPLGKGRPRPLLGDLVTSASVHGKSAMDGIALPDPVLPETPPAAFDVLTGTFLDAPQKVTLIATGPLTNVAVALLARPEIKEKIERIIWMGGAIAQGNITPSAEFNAYVDPEAAQIVMDSGLPLTMVGLDVTHRALIFPSQFEELRQLGRAGELAAEILRRYWVAYERRGFSGVPIHDATAVAATFAQGLIKTQKARVDVELSGGHTRGRTVVDLAGITGREPNCYVAVDINREMFLEILLSGIRGLADFHR